jgi:hypothetical protein
MAVTIVHGDVQTIYDGGKNATVCSTLKGMVGIESSIVPCIREDSTIYNPEIHFSTKALKAFAAIGIVVGVVAAIVTIVALLAIFCPPLLVAAAGAVGMAIATMGLGTLIGVAISAGLLGIGSFLFGGRAIQLLCRAP